MTNPLEPSNQALGVSPDGDRAWQPIETAPFQTVIEVRNPVMERPVLATRGYCHNGMVHPNDTFCTTVFTPDPDGLFPFPAGRLCCPTEWRKLAEQVSA